MGFPSLLEFCKLCLPVEAKVITLSDGVLNVILCDNAQFRIYFAYWVFNFNDYIFHFKFSN